VFVAADMKSLGAAHIRQLEGQLLDIYRHDCFGKVSEDGIEAGRYYLRNADVGLATHEDALDSVCVVKIRHFASSKTAPPRHLPPAAWRRRRQ